MIMGVSITKQISWRGQQEQFSNVYHFNTDVGVTSDQVIDNTVTEEKKVFSSQVTFVKAQAWGPTDQGPAASQMLNQKNLSGAGTLGTSGSAYPEGAAVVEWPTGRFNSRGKPIFFRKYLHMGGCVSGLSAGLAQAALGAGDTTPLTTYANNVKNVVGPSGASLCDKQGRGLPVGTTPKVLPYLHTRQFRR